MAGMKSTAHVWINGELVEWGEATVHVGCHGLHYGSGVFARIRCYLDAAAGRIEPYAPWLEYVPARRSIETPA